LDFSEFYSFISIISTFQNVLEEEIQKQIKRIENEKNKELLEVIEL
jgi:hypothetical protein